MHTPIPIDTLRLYVYLMYSIKDAPLKGKELIF